jgi:hypothetical protein
MSKEKTPCKMNLSFDFSRRLSIDQLTEEAEADLANNNDPNNNASSGNDGQDQGNNYHQDQHEVHEQQQQQQMMATADGGPIQNNQNSAFEFDFDEPTETETVNSRLSFDVDDDDVDPFQAALDRDVQLILKLMPDKAQDEVRYMLESHPENPSRVQVRRFFFLSNPLRLVTCIRKQSEFRVSFSRKSVVCRNIDEDVFY